MSLSSSTLSAIQKTGAAAFHAQARLKKDEKAFAAKIQESMGSNAYSRVNDLMFEHWKVIARITQTLAGMEAELKKIYAIASELAVDEQGLTQELIALAAPTTSAAMEQKANGNTIDLSPTDISPKTKNGPQRKKGNKKMSERGMKIAAAFRRKRLARMAEPAPGAQATLAAKTTKTVVGTKRRKPYTKENIAGVRRRPYSLSPSAEKLLRYLNTQLNANTHVPLNQSTAAVATGIPMGSMTAAMKKLIEGKKIEAGPSGSFRLVSAPNTPANGTR
jgi:hypothetical protein